MCQGHEQVDLHHRNDQVVGVSGVADGLNAFSQYDAARVRQERGEDGVVVRFVAEQ